MVIGKEKYYFVVYLTYSMAHDFAVCFHQCFCIKRGFTKKHLVYTDTQRPPIAFNTILPSPVLYGL